MSTIYPPALSHFAVFSPALATDEDNAHEQLLFYAAATLPAFYPCSANDYYARSAHLRRRSSGSSNSSNKGTTSPSEIITAQPKPAQPTRTTQERVVSLDTKLREIGLASALVMFSGTFGNPKNTDQRDDHAFHFVHSEKRRMVVFEAEPQVLIQLSIVLPRLVKPYNTKKGSARQQPKSAYSVEFLDSELSDDALRAWVLQEYHAYRLIFGPISVALADDVQGVRRTLDLFFGRTVWGWDARWDRRGCDELDVMHTLAPLPQISVSAISLGGFDELWHDLKQLAVSGDQLLVGGLVVLWRGKDLVWSSTIDSADLDNDSSKYMPNAISSLRAVISFSHVMFSSLFTSQPEVAVRRTQHTQHTQSSDTQRQRNSSSWSSNNSWLWGWQRPAAVTSPRQTQQDSDDSSGGSTPSQANSSENIPGIAQVLSRAVNALVEPRPPTPPEIDPMFSNSAEIHGEEETSDQPMLAQGSDASRLSTRESDAVSVSSVRSRSSAHTALGVSRQAPIGILRERANTTEQHWRPRSPSVMSSASYATADSGIMRSDTRVSTRSSAGWWGTWGWGRTRKTSSQPAPDEDQAGILEVDEEHCDASAQVDPKSAFLFTGNLPFPGLGESAASKPEHIRVDDSDEVAPPHGTATRLEEAMLQDLPDVYHHGTSVDLARGIVVAPRAVAGMQYDSRVLRAVYDAKPTITSVPVGSSRVHPAEAPLFIDVTPSAVEQGSQPPTGPCAKLVYKYGDLLFVVLGTPTRATGPSRNNESDPSTVELETSSSSRGARRSRRRRQRRTTIHQLIHEANSSPDPAHSLIQPAECQAIEGVILRYAESLQATAWRDMQEQSAHNESESRLAERRRVPPYIYSSNQRSRVQSNWSSSQAKRNDRSAEPEDIGRFRPYLGFLPGSTGVSNSRPGGSAVARRALAALRSEAVSANKNVSVCARLHDKGWVASRYSRDDELYCAVDMPAATLADARAFLDNISRRVTDWN